MQEELLKTARPIAAAANGADRLLIMDIMKPEDVKYTNMTMMQWKQC